MRRGCAKHELMSKTNYSMRMAPAHEGQTWLAQLPQLMAKGRVITSGRHRVLHIDHPADTAHPGFAVKAFGRQPAWKDAVDAKRGSKAQRSFQTAVHLEQHGVGTPEPVAVMERWEGKRLEESYLVTVYVPALSNFRDELVRIYRHDPDCGRLMHLMETVAKSIANLHNCGCAHRDLGNQNIALRSEADGAWSVWYLDLNRARLGKPLAMQQRAFDLSRISLPSDFLRVFKAMYFGDTPVPPEFERWERYYRKRFAWHTWTRKFRHPVRAARQRQQPQDPDTTYPPIRSIWIWDERSGQAISTLERKDRKRLHSKRETLRVAGAVAKALPRVLPAYRRLRSHAFEQPVELAGRTGMTIHPRPSSWEAERGWLEGLGRMPLLMRFYHHESDTACRYLMERARELRRDGYPLSLALVQDRRAVEEPKRWQQFVRLVMDELADEVEHVEIGHAINRTKWGLWSMDDYARLCEPFTPYVGRCKLMGPAVIDFEFHYLVAALDRIRNVLPLDAVSLHLYVDRRGAPENQQAGFDTAAKCALAKAIAGDLPLIISEVNWPLSGTGVYSPVNSPYLTPGPRRHDPGVDEDAYARYLLRYLIQTLGTGLVERVYWWRLAAHGYGLIDDLSGRLRPAYHALQNWLQLLSQARYMGTDTTLAAHIAVPVPTLRFYPFELKNGEIAVFSYNIGENVVGSLPFRYEYATSMAGKKVDTEVITIGGDPIWFRGVQF